MPQPGDAVHYDHEQRERSEIFTRTIAVAGESVLRYEDGTRIWLFSAVFWMIFVTVLGLTMAIELTTPNLFAGIPWLLFSRIRPIHVNGVIFAWLSMMYWGALFYVLPRLLGRPRLWGENVAYWTAWAWNILLVGADVTLASGFTQGREYWELIWPGHPADYHLVHEYAVVIGSVLRRRVKPLYVQSGGSWPLPCGSSLHISSRM